MPVEIDDLPTTILQARTHVVPAMKDGLTVRLTLAQILGLAAGTDVSFNAAGMLVISGATVQAALAATDAALKSRSDVSTAIAADLALNKVPPGAVCFFAANTAPTGWLKANGALVSRATYVNLFNYIGTTFGVGNGTTTFGLPDLRGEFLRNWDDGRGIDTSRVFGSAQAHMFQTHTHNVDGYTLVGSYRQDGTSTAVSTGGSGLPVSAPTSGNYGSETRPRNIALLGCIKY